MIRKIIPLLLSFTLIGAPLYAEPSYDPTPAPTEEESLVDGIINLGRDALKEAVGELKEDLDQSRIKREAAAKQKPIHLHRYQDIIEHLDISIEREKSPNRWLQALEDDQRYRLKITFRNPTERPIIIEGLELERNLLLIDEEGLAYTADIPQQSLQDFEIFSKSGRQLSIPFQYQGEKIAYFRFFNEDIPLK